MKIYTRHHQLLNQYFKTTIDQRTYLLVVKLCQGEIVLASFLTFLDLLIVDFVRVIY